MLFRAVKRVRPTSPRRACSGGLARAGVSILSPHTAFDNTVGGINDGLAAPARAGRRRPAPAVAAGRIVQGRRLHARSPTARRSCRPRSRPGRGGSGLTSECSFAIPGDGTFFGTEGANPTVGQAGRRETVREQRLEVVCPADRLAAVLAAIRSAHSYEEPAIDVYPLHAGPGGPGAGRVGRLPAPSTLARVRRRGRAMRSPPRRSSSSGSPTARSIGWRSSAARGTTSSATPLRAGADVLLTGEARFHRALEAEALGIGLVVAGHHATERPGVEDLADRLADDVPRRSPSGRAAASPTRSGRSGP